MMRGRSTCWRCLRSFSSTTWPAAVIGIFSTTSQSSEERETQIQNAGRSSLPPAFQIGIRRALTFVAGPSGRLTEIALQCADLEVAPKVGLDALRRSDGTGKSGVVRHFMQEGCPPERLAVGQGSGPLGGVENKLNPAIFDGIDD